MKRTLLTGLAAGFFAFSAHAEQLTFPQYAALVEKHAAAQGLDKNLVWAVIGRESEGKPTALSNKDARGLMQVIPPTAAKMGVSPKMLYDPEQNIIAGTRYLRYLSQMFRGNIDLILAGYNAGPGAVQKYGGIPPYAETRAYVKNVKYRYAKLSGNSAYTHTDSGTLMKAAYKPKPVPASVQPAVQTAVYAQRQKQYAEWDIFQEF